MEGIYKFESPLDAGWFQSLAKLTLTSFHPVWLSLTGKTFPFLMLSLWRLLWQGADFAEMLLQKLSPLSPSFPPDSGARVLNELWIRIRIRMWASGNSFLGQTLKMAVSSFDRLSTMASTDAAPHIHWRSSQLWCIPLRPLFKKNIVCLWKSPWVQAATLWNLFLQ